MNVLDLIIVIAAIGAGIGGWRIGFITRVASWIGMGLGLYLAARLLPRVVEALDGSPQVRIFLVAVIVLIAGAFVGQALGLLVGSKLHLALPHGQARRVDRAGGAAAGVLGVLAAVWLLAPVGAEISGWPAEQIRNSTVTRAVDRVFPAAPDPLRTLRQLIGEDRFPRVFDALQPAPDLGAPPGSSGLSPETEARVAASTVKVEAQACGRIQDGSGSFVGDDIVITNAHVVAGADEIDVIPGGAGDTLDAELVAFDPNRDLAVLRVPESDQAALPISDIDVGGNGAVFGYPGGGPLEISPFQVGDEVTAIGTDIYDRSQTRREVFVLAAELRPGDSGGALVNLAGEVVAVAFAIAPDRPNVAYALTTEEVNAVLGRDLGASVGSGPCLGT